MSTVIIVGCDPVIISGTDSTDSIVTNDSTRPTSSVPRHLRQHDVDQHAHSATRRDCAPPRCARSIDAIAPASSSVTNGACFHTKAMTMPRQSSRLCVCERLDQAERRQHVVQQPVLGEERPHASGRRR